MTFEAHKPNRLPQMTYDECLARAQRILDHRGQPPYKMVEHYPGLTPDEIAIISEYVWHWLPYIVEKEKPDAPSH